MVSEFVVIVAITAAIIGAVASTIQGYKAADSSYSIKKLTSALISSVFFALALVNISNVQDSIGQLGLVGIFVTYAILGYGIDKTHSALDR